GFQLFNDGQQVIGGEFYLVRYSSHSVLPLCRPSVPVPSASAGLHQAGRQSARSSRVYARRRVIVGFSVRKARWPSSIVPSGERRANRGVGATAAAQESGAGLAKKSPRYGCHALTPTTRPPPALADAGNGAGRTDAAAGAAGARHRPSR